MSDAVKKIVTPIRLEYTVTAGPAKSRFLRALAERRIIGERCPSCSKVYVPPRGVCPTCAQATDTVVEVSTRGTLTTYCVVNVPIPGQDLALPYVAGSVLLDGADLPLFGAIQEIDVADVRMGLRVEAVWADEPSATLGAIAYYRPIDEPDAPFDAFAEHL